METTRLIPRRQFVVDPKFQYGLILKFVFLVSVVLLVSLILLTIFFNLFSNNALPVSVETGGVMSFEITQGMRLSDEIPLVTAVMLLSILTGSIGVYFFGVFSSHRMAGPVPRLRKCIDEMSHGELDRNVSLRKSDYIHPLATDINCLRQQWHDSILDLKTINKQLNEVAGAEQKELLSRSNKILSDLYKKVS